MSSGSSCGMLSAEMTAGLTKEEIQALESDIKTWNADQPAEAGSFKLNDSFIPVVGQQNTSFTGMYASSNDNSHGSLADPLRKSQFPGVPVVGLTGQAVVGQSVSSSGNPSIVLQQQNSQQINSKSGVNSGLGNIHITTMSAPSSGNPQVVNTNATSAPTKKVTNVRYGKKKSSTNAQKFNIATPVTGGGTLPKNFGSIQIDAGGAGLGSGNRMQQSAIQIGAGGAVTNVTGVVNMAGGSVNLTGSGNPQSIAIAELAQEAADINQLIKAEITEKQNFLIPSISQALKQYTHFEVLEELCTDVEHMRTEYRGLFQDQLNVFDAFKTRTTTQSEEVGQKIQNINSELVAMRDEFIEAVSRIKEVKEDVAIELDVYKNVNDKNMETLMEKYNSMSQEFAQFIETNAEETEKLKALVTATGKKFSAANEEMKRLQTDLVVMRADMDKRFKTSEIAIKKDMRITAKKLSENLAANGNAIANNGMGFVGMMNSGISNDNGSMGMRGIANGNGSLNMRSSYAGSTDVKTRKNGSAVRKSSSSPRKLDGLKLNENILSPAEGGDGLEKVPENLLKNDVNGTEHQARAVQIGVLQGGVNQGSVNRDGFLSDSQRVSLQKMLPDKEELRRKIQTEVRRQLQVLEKQNDQKFEQQNSELSCVEKEIRKNMVSLSNKITQQQEKHASLLSRCKNIEDSESVHLSSLNRSFEQSMTALERKFAGQLNESITRCHADAELYHRKQVMNEVETLQLETARMRERSDMLERRVVELMGMLHRGDSPPCKPQQKSTSSINGLPCDKGEDFNNVNDHLGQVEGEKNATVVDINSLRASMANEELKSDPPTGSANESCSANQVSSPSRAGTNPDCGPGNNAQVLYFSTATSPNAQVTPSRNDSNGSDQGESKALEYIEAELDIMTAGILGTLNAGSFDQA